MFVVKTLIIFKIVLQCCSPSWAEPNWTYEFVGFETKTDNPDVINFNMNLTRVSRGIFAFSGTCELGEDITNDSQINVDIFYSFTGSNYMRTAFRVPKTTVPNFLKTYYEDIVYASLLTCSTNTPKLNDEGFLGKGVSEFKNCLVDNENMPSHMKDGFYRIVLTMEGQANAAMEITAKVDLKD